MLSSKTTHPDEAWTFLKYLASPDVQEGWMKLTGAPPARISLAEKWYKQFPSMTPEEVKAVHLGALKHGRESPNHLLVRFDQLNQIVSSAVDPIMNNEKTPGQTLPDANKALIEALKQIQAEYKK
jgi:multiple sugar transport system substrate-binding protein